MEFGQCRGHDAACAKGPPAFHLRQHPELGIRRGQLQARALPCHAKEIRRGQIRDGQENGAGIRIRADLPQNVHQWRRCARNRQDQLHLHDQGHGLPANGQKPAWAVDRGS